MSKQSRAVRTCSSAACRNATATRRKTPSAKWTRTCRACDPMGAAHVLPPVLRTTIVVCGAHFLTYALTGRGLIARARALFARHHARLGDGDERNSPPSDPI